MNMQAMMQQAQKLQKELLNTKKILDETEYEGKSSLVNVKINGKKEILSVKINADDSFGTDDLELLEDMIMVAFNDAIKKADKERESKMSKYGSGLGGLL